MRKPPSILIPAAGFGYRLKSSKPRPLISLNRQQTLVERQISLLRSSYPKSDITVVLGDRETILDIPSKTVKIVNEDAATTNVAHSIKLGLDEIDNNRVLIVYGDLVFNKEAIHRLTTRGSLVVQDSHGQMKNSEVGLYTENRRVSHFAYGISPKWCQIVYLEKREYALYRQEEQGRSHCTGFEILNLVIQAGGQFKVIEPEGMRIVEVDSPKDLALAKELVKCGF